VNTQDLRRSMVVGRSGAPLITVLAGVEEVFNTSTEHATIQSKFVSNIHVASKPMLSNSLDVYHASQLYDIRSCREKS